jgi:hypothetical protein
MYLRLFSEFFVDKLIAVQGARLLQDEWDR